MTAFSRKCPTSSFLAPFYVFFCVLVFVFSQHLRNQIGAQGAMELLIFWGEKACEAQNFDMSPHDAVMDAAKAAYHGDADPELVLRSLGEADGPIRVFRNFNGWGNDLESNAESMRLCDCMFRLF